MFWMRPIPVVSDQEARRTHESLEDYRVASTIAQRTATERLTSCTHLQRALEEEMEKEHVVELSRMLRECIRRIESTTDESDRSLRRVLALLWNACDELALLESGDLSDSP
jgi:hypothetical protein